MTRKMRSMHGAVAAIALAIIGVGCSGSDGSQGPQGPQGNPGIQGPPGDPGAPGGQIQATTEACRGCHGQFADKHKGAPAEQVLVTVDPVFGVTVSSNGQDIILKFNVKVDGVPNNDFLDKSGVVGGHYEDAWWVYYAASTAGERTKIAPNAWQLAWNGNGNYTATLTGVGALTTPMGQSSQTPGAMFMVSTRAPNGLVATAVGHFPQNFRAANQSSGRRSTLISNQACMNCHGTFVWRGAVHDATNPQGIEPCLFCHNRFGAVELRLAGSYSNPARGAEGSGLMGLVHGIHNSANMPDAEYAWTWTNDTSGNKFSFSFPGYMNNCSTCHDSTAALNAVKTAPMSFALCVSCHDTAKIGTAPNSHANFTAGQCGVNIPCNCYGCHDNTLEDVAFFHNGLKTERAGVIWDGADQSVVWGKRVKTDITSVGYDAGGLTTLVVTWTAQWDPDGDGTFDPVDPCNSNYALGPVFLNTTVSAANGRSDENMSLLKAYGLGNDWVNGITGQSSPGQPNSTNLRLTGGTTSASSTNGRNNTTCSGNVATSKIPAETQFANGTRAAVALQGKPQLRIASVPGHAATFDAMVGTSTEIIQVRAQSPVREYVVGTGAAPAETRRQIVSIDKCNACHLGSMYQHGGNRVDKIELCVMCHNPASSEQQNRTNWGVTAAEAYDGKVGQTYDMRTMVHAIHSAGETNGLLVYYRSNGIYAFGSSSSIAAIPNWKTGASITCQGTVEGRPAAVTSYQVYGSSITTTGQTVQVPTASGPGSAVTLDPNGVCSALDVTRLPAGYTANVQYKTFNEIPVHYPRSLNQCTACHVNDTEKAFPDAKKAMAVTLDIGGTTASNLVDDVLKGPSAASCMSCHQYGDAATKYYLNKHSFDNGWWPAVFENGRQTLIDAAP